MSTEIIKLEPRELAIPASPGDPPAIILAGRSNARFAYDEFFASNGRIDKGLIIGSNLVLP